MAFILNKIYHYFNQVVNGTRCDNNSACERKGEVCQRNLLMDEQFCTRKMSLPQRFFLSIFSIQLVFYDVMILFTELFTNRK